MAVSQRLDNQRKNADKSLKNSFYVGWVACFPQPNTCANPVGLPTAQPNLRLLS
jgi:hypothetical protein